MIRRVGLLALLFAFTVSTYGVSVQAQQNFVFVEYKLGKPIARNDLVSALEVGAMVYSISNNRRDEVQTSVEYEPNGTAVVRFVFFTYFSNPPAIPKRWQTTDLNLYLKEEQTDRIVIQGKKPGTDPPGAEGLNAHVQSSFDAYISYVAKEVLKTEAVRVG